MDWEQAVSGEPKHSYERVSAELQRRIERGEIRVGQFLPTERELQEECGVSRTTLRRALGMLIEDGWAENVPSKGVLAKKPRYRSTSRNIALIDAETYVLRVLHVRLGELLSPQGFHLVHLGVRVHNSMEQAVQYACDHGFAGALVWSFLGFPGAEAIAKSQLPIVLMDHRIRGMEADLVTFDYMKAAYDAVSHIIAQGRRRIAVAGFLDMMPETHDRFSGYMKALFDHDLKPNARDYVFSNTSGQIISDTSLLEYRLRCEDRPDAVFVLQDEFYPEVVECILRVGLSIPEDIALVTVGDDIDITVGGVGMTAVGQDWESMARMAVELLIDRINHPERPFVTQYAPMQLVVRGLCGAPPLAWTSQPGELTSFRGKLPIPRSQYHFDPTRSTSVESGTPYTQ